MELISLSRENLFLVGPTEVLAGTSLEGWNAHLCGSGHMVGGQDREVKSASHETHGLRLGQVCLSRENQQKREWLLGRVLTAGGIVCTVPISRLEVNCRAREHTG